MAGDPDVTDVLTADLERLYSTATRRLSAIVRAGLNRGLDPARLGTRRQRAGDATLAYRQRQHEQAQAVLESLRTATRDLAGRTVGIAYSSGMVAVEDTIGEQLNTFSGQFGRIHIAAVEQVAANLEASLRAAVDAVDDRIGDVFERAQALEGALREDRPVFSGGRFIGRRHNDPWRRIGLEITGEGTIGLDTRRQRSVMLARRLVTEGLSDGITGLVDASGRRWALDTYAEMVTRTTTAEAVTQGTLNRLAEGEAAGIGEGLDLVAITSHPHQADVCTPYDGQVFSRTGRTPGYPVLSATPPFHPWCRHRLGPASANLDEFERRLRARVRENVEPVRAAGPQRLPDGRQGRVLEGIDAEHRADLFGPTELAQAERQGWVRADQGLGGVASYTLTEDGREALELRRRYDAALRKPGASDASARLEAGALPREVAAPARSAVGSPWGRQYDPIHTTETVDRFVDQELTRMLDADPGPDPERTDELVRRAKLDERRLNRALRGTFGEPLWKFVTSAKGKRQDLRRRYVDGDLTLDDLEDIFAEDWNDREERAARKEAAKFDAGYETRPFPCFSCGSFKRRPGDVCRVCGDDPVPLNSSEEDFNRAYGYAASRQRDRWGSQSAADMDRGGGFSSG